MQWGAAQLQCEVSSSSLMTPAGLGWFFWRVRRGGVTCRRLRIRGGILGMSLDAFHGPGVGLLDGALDFAELRKVGQALQIFQSEQFEELIGGLIDHRATRRVLAPGNLDEPFFEQRFEHAARVNAAQLFDLGPRDRLPIGDYRDRLHAAGG